MQGSVSLCLTVLFSSGDLEVSNSAIQIHCARYILSFQSSYMSSPPHLLLTFSLPPPVSSRLVSIPGSRLCLFFSRLILFVPFSHSPPIVPLSPDHISPSSCVLLACFFFCHFAISLSLFFFSATLFPPIFSQFSSSLPQHLPQYSPFPSLALPASSTLQSPSLFQPLLSSHLLPLHSLLILPPSSTPLSSSPNQFPLSSPPESAWAVPSVFPTHRRRYQPVIFTFHCRLI